MPQRRIALLHAAPARNLSASARLDRVSGQACSGIAGDERGSVVGNGSRGLVAGRRGLVADRPAFDARSARVATYFGSLWLLGFRLRDFSKKAS